MFFEEVVHGFVFLVKEEQFNPDEKNMLTLFAELLKVIISRTEIHDYVQKQNRIYQEEISRVRQIQVAQLPKFKNIHGFEIASTFLPAEDISGDFFDGFFINGNTDIFQIFSAGKCIERVSNNRGPYPLVVNPVF